MFAVFGQAPTANALVKKIAQQPEQYRMHQRIQIDFELSQPGIANAVIGQRNRRIMVSLILFEQGCYEAFRAFALRIRNVR